VAILEKNHKKAKKFLTSDVVLSIFYS